MSVYSSRFRVSSNTPNMSKLAHIDPEDLIESESEGTDEQLPTYLFEDVEEELTKILLSDTDLEETDGAFDVIKDMVSKVQHEISKRGAGNNLTNFLNTLSKVFTLLLNIKVDTGDKIVKIVNLLNSLIAKKWSEQN